MNKENKNQESIAIDEIKFKEIESKDSVYSHIHSTVYEDNQCYLVV